MDTIMIEKLHAMKRYRRKKQLLPSLIIQFSLTILLISLFLSSPLWLPSACSSLRPFLVSIPKMGAAILGPKSLFIVCNAIIIFLVGESKLSKSSPDIYGEYVNRSTGLRRLPTDELEKPLVDDKRERDGGEKKEGDGACEWTEEGYEDLDGKGGKGLDELHRRVEDFIARVNKQRRLELRMLGGFGEERLK